MSHLHLVSTARCLGAIVAKQATQYFHSESVVKQRTPIILNHHACGAFRVGKTVTPEFRLTEPKNLSILQPSAHLDVDDDANPMLKSLVLSSFAMDAVARDLMVRA